MALPPNLRLPIKNRVIRMAFTLLVMVYAVSAGLFVTAGICTFSLVYQYPKHLLCAIAAGVLKSLTIGMDLLLANIKA